MTCQMRDKFSFEVRIHIWYWELWQHLVGWMVPWFGANMWSSSLRFLWKYVTNLRN